MAWKRKWGWVAVGVCCAALQLAAQNGPSESDWDKLRQSKNTAELEEFILKYPTSREADLASRRIDELAWERVDKTNESAVEAFFRSHPDLVGTLTYVKTTPPPEQETTPSTPTLIKSPTSDSISRTLKRYADAHANRNIDEIRAVWPRIDGDSFKRIQRILKDKDTSVTMLIDIIAGPEIEGDIATVVCKQRMETVSDGKSHPTSALLKVQLRRVGQEWAIQTLQ